MGQTREGALTGVQAAWAIAERLKAGECLTLEDAARIVAGCGNGNEAAWYSEFDDSARSHFRARARRILREGVDSGAVNRGVITVDNRSEDVWEICRENELAY